MLSGGLNMVVYDRLVGGRMGPLKRYLYSREVHELAVMTLLKVRCRRLGPREA